MGREVTSVAEVDHSNGEMSLTFSKKGCCFLLLICSVFLPSFSCDLILKCGRNMKETKLTPH